MRKSLRNVDVEAVLQKLGIQYVVRDNFELYSRCPNPEHKDKDPSWHIHSELKHPKNGVFHCWSCKWSGNVVNLVMKVKGISFSHAVRFVELCKKEIVYDDQQVTDDDYEKIFKGEPGEISMEWKGSPIVLEPIVCGVGKAWEYLQSRFIGQKYIELFGLLDWKEKQRVIVPIRREGRLISWIGRSYVGDKPKTLAPKNAPKRWELFGYDQINLNVNAISVTEGWVDVIRLLQIGRPNPIALCGSKATEYQVEFLSQFKNIELWLDGDKAGEVMAENLVSWLGHGRRISVVDLPEGKDPGSYAPWKLAEFESVDWGSYTERRKANGSSGTETRSEGGVCP